VLKHGTAYVDEGQKRYEERYRTRVVQNLKRKAKELGFALVEAVEKQPKLETT
jgi:transposase